MIRSECKVLQGAWFPIPDGYEMLNDVNDDVRVMAKEELADDKKKQCTVLTLTRYLIVDNTRFKG